LIFLDIGRCWRTEKRAIQARALNVTSDIQGVLYDQNTTDDNTDTAGAGRVVVSAITI
jgi:LPS-assembly lipoprotein